MVYQSIRSESAAHQLGKLDRTVSKWTLDRVQELGLNPLRSLRRLVAVPYYRLRVGDFRVIIEVAQYKLLGLVLNVGRRSKIY